MTQKENGCGRLTAAVLVLSLVTFVWFLADGGLIEFGGDAFGRWEDLVNAAVAGKALNTDHHSLRWGLNLPILLVLKIVGVPHPALYHAFMPAFGAGTAVALYLSIRQSVWSKKGDIAFCCLTLTLMILPLSERPFSQLLPMGAATFYMCLTIYLLKRALDPDDRNTTWWFFFAGMSSFCAYGAKLTMLFFGAPLSIVLIFMLLRERKVLEAGAFFAPLIIGLIIETWQVYAGSGSLLGRALFVVSELSSHGKGLNYLGALDVGTDIGGWGFGSLWSYLVLSPTKYFEALGFYSLVIYGSVFLALMDTVSRRLNHPAKKLNFCLAWTILGFFFLQSYVVVSIEPYIFPEKYIHERYQYALFMLSAIFLIRRACEIKWLQAPGDALGGSYRIFVVAIILLVLSAMFLSNNLRSRHNNYGVLVTIIHNALLSKWATHGGALGYMIDSPEETSLTAARSALRSGPQSGVISDYSRAIYRLDYCELKDSYVYADTNWVYAFCRPWGINETILIYRITSISWIRPETPRFLGKFSPDTQS